MIGVDLSRYNKFLAALYLGVLGWASYVVAAHGGTFGPVSDAEWLALAAALGTAIGVRQIPNTPPSSPAPAPVTPAPPADLPPRPAPASPPVAPAPAPGVPG